jgi:hypothetical protein
MAKKTTNSTPLTSAIKPIITQPPTMVAFNEANNKPSRFYLKGTNFGASPSVNINSHPCEKVTVNGNVLSVLLHFADHPHLLAKKPGKKQARILGTGEVNITITVQNNDPGGALSDPITVTVYVDDDSSE